MHGSEVFHVFLALLREEKKKNIRKRSNWYWLVVKQMCAPKPTLLIV